MNFNVGDEVQTKDEFVSKVSEISLAKKLKNFIKIKTEAVSNSEALKKNKEVVSFIQDMYKDKIDEYIKNNNNKILNIKSQIYNLENKEIKDIQREIEKLKNQKIAQIDKKIYKLKYQDIINIEREIKKLKNQKIAKIDKKIAFLKDNELKTLENKILIYANNLKQYQKSINNIYKQNRKNSNQTTSTIASLQMVNYQNLILNAQNKIEDLKLQIKTIKEKTIPNLRLEKENVQNITIKDLKIKIDNIKNFDIKNLELEKENIKNDKIKHLEYMLNVTLPNKKQKLLIQIKNIQYLNSKAKVQNSKVIGRYIVHNYPIKPKKKLIVIVAFITGLILSIFIVFFIEFLKNEDNPK